MAVKIRLRRMGQKKNPFIELSLLIQDHQETEDLSKKSEHMILIQIQVHSM